MKITFVISSLEAGGAQRVMCMLANYWDNNGWQVTLISLSDLGHDFYQLNTGVKRVGLDLLKPSQNLVHAICLNFQRLLKLRQSIQNSSPEVVISFADRMNVMTLISSYGLGIPVLISERIDPREHNIGRFWCALRDRFYPRAKKLVVQSQPVLIWASKRWPKLESEVIHNPVTVIESKASTEVIAAEYKWCIGVGRLVRQKGFDLLINAFSNLVKTGAYDDWRLIILGEGEERDELETQVEISGLTDHVLMPGEVKNPADYLYQADLFVMPSRYEGFPNALLEALACGLPVISTDCPSGPAEIIQQNINGMLVDKDNPAALASEMEKLMGSQALREQLGKNAVKSVSGFEVASIMKQWEDAIEEATKAVS